MMPSHRNPSGAVFSTYRTKFARLSLKTRGLTSSETCLAAISYRNSRKRLAVPGATEALIARLALQPMTPSSMTGKSRRIMERPLARKAIASLSDDILPNPVKMPTNTAIGMVKVKTLGRMASEIAQVSEIVADWRTINSNSHPISREKARNATKVSAASAITDGKKISLKM